jgi:hypothetical protein
MFTSSNDTEKTFLAKIGIHFKAYHQTFQEVGEICPGQNGLINEVSAGTD